MKLLLTLFACCFLFSCQTTKVSTIENFNGKVIIFGSKGGFTNSTTEYRIYENGQFEKYLKSAQSIEPLNRLASNQCDQIFNNFYSLGLDKMDVDEPGNMSYFIQMKNGNSNKKLRWKSADATVPHQLKQYYKILGQIAKKSKTVK